VDYGPYKTDEILSEIERYEVTASSTLLEQNSGVKIRVDEISAFSKACKDAQAARAAKKLADETEAHYSEMRQNQRLKPVLFGLLALLVVIGVWQFKRMGLGTTEYETAHASPLSVVPGAKANFIALAEQPKPAKEDLVAVKPSSKPKKKLRRKRRRGSKVKAKAAAPTQPETQEFDFSDDEDAVEAKATGLQPLTPIEVQRVQGALRPRFRQCFRKSAEQVPAGTYSVRTKLLRSGVLSPPTLAPSSDQTAALHSCLKMVTSMVKTRAFSGPTQTVQASFSIAP